MITKRTKRTRYKLKKVSNRKRLTVFRSNKHLYAQVIDDSVGKTLASASTKEKNMDIDNKDRKSLAQIIGKNIAQRSIEKGIKEVAFDKGKYKYHGLIKILADSARTEGLIF
jgi:large subunit ribosomal protein L18